MGDTTYTQSWHPAVTASHAARTAEVEGSFVLPHLQPSHNILDIGCGPGTITYGFAPYVPDGRVTGIDLNQEILDQAYSNLSKRALPLSNVEFKIGNVLEGLKFDDDSFDVVFCNQVLLHTPDPVKALREMKRVCKPGGFVACRESDFPFRWYPYLPGLQLYDRYMYEQVIGALPSVASKEHPQNPPHAPGHRAGILIHVWAREAGFEVQKMVKGAGVELKATEDERKRHAENLIGRFERGEHREKWKRLGASDEDIDTVIRDVKAWRDDVDGWYAILQGQVICGV
ncbi:S-adenosyl-L-methionine-dependent methyltransferase [Aaosphaeria arxii CBS 175.79]|uniref:S-adenosyl-L-methionine-dependent methyltransferase n=1 Tax=Aaosphaeria arxii CBS 175.79 TaxID=1450172 RepID=A0A6A5XXJ3_9PLEO|nr:S-adenosyl-L-methionine-dependent methyltransferase [Aaosphaeria arxii CBS 175.79]KAF2017451.1 S-adenosyl-L-methionine-dependent methyltransferase [Aaosphaeria arxii CBS 175.79]